ncbi:MAG: hypothetical protein J6Z12_05860 [Paludibacteraceae bacterium]|nr:hypothetical protein [Paludibacteraceae bacterium]
MKRFVCMLGLLTATTALHAQLSTVGGNISLWGNADELTFSFAPEVEFELTEHWELAVGAGVTTVTDLNFKTTTVLGEASVGVAYIIWGNEWVEVAVAAEGGITYNRLVQGAEIGLVPELRFTPCEHLELGLSLGMLGTEYNRAEGWSGGLVLSSNTAGIHVAYKF